MSDTAPQVPSQRYFRLEGHEPVPCADMQEWIAAWTARGDHHLAICHVGDVLISTIFLGIADPLTDLPLVFETMALGLEIGPGRIRKQVRTATWDEAMTEHEVCVAEMQLRQGPRQH